MIMARMRILLLLAALMAGNAAAERKPFAFGLYGGVSGSTFWGKDMGEGDFTIFPTAGFFAGLNLPELFGAELDLLYVDKDGSFSTTGPKGEFQSNNLTVQTLEMPLLVKITAPTGNEVMPIFFGGPSISFLLQHKSESEYILTDAFGTVTSQPLDPAYIPQPDMEKIDWSLMIGGGLEWGLGTFQLRFDLGQNSLDRSDKIDLKTMSSMIIAGFIF
jgi:hypothetical protein